MKNLVYALVFQDSVLILLNIKLVCLSEVVPYMHPKKCLYFDIVFVYFDILFVYI